MISLLQNLQRPHVIVTHSTTQSIGTSGTEQEVVFDTDEADVWGFHDTSSNTQKLLVPTGFDGLYEVHANLAFASNTTGVRGALLYKNGLASGTFLCAQRAGAVSAVACYCSVSTLVRLAAGDYIAVTAYQNSGGALNLNGAGTRMSMCRISS